MLIDDLKADSVKLIELQSELTRAKASSEKHDEVVTKLEHKLKQLESDNRSYQALLGKQQSQLAALKQEVWLEKQANLELFKELDQTK